MYRGALPFGLSLLLLSAGLPARADPEQTTRLKQVQALQEVVQRTIRAAEPAVACLLVSRSDAYQRFGQGPAADNPGRLGALDLDALDRYLARLDLSAEERARQRQRLDLSDPATVPESFGSGVVIDPAGLVLTNYHVVRDATKVYVRLPDDGGAYADIYAADPRSDLAVLRLLGPKHTYKAIQLGDGGKAERGQFVVALANPFAAGFRDGRPSASCGIISNVRRRAADGTREEERGRTLQQYGILLQTDVRLNLGCSGGALLNLRGELIGLTTALAAVQGSDSPGGFALPIEPGILRIIDVLRKGREVEYGFLGVSCERKAGGAEGVPLSWVTRGSPADRYHLHVGDRILAVNGTPVHGSDDLFLALGTLLAGSTVALDVQQAKTRQRLHVEVPLAKYYVHGKKVASDRMPRPFFRGLRVDYTSILVQLPQTPGGWRSIPSGVLVSEVQPDSPAATALLRPGEVITHVNSRPVETPAAFYHEVSGATGPVELTLASTRPGQPSPKVVLN
jgi:S1-C subfamily serine protease